MKSVRRGGDYMLSIETIFQTCNNFLMSSWSQDVEIVRQGTPPDEDYALAQEELAESVSYANRCAEIQAWNLVRHVS
jgi:hypothetical protein